MIGKPNSFIQPISVRSAINQTQIPSSLNSSANISNNHYGKQAPNFHPRPMSIRMKLGSDPKDLPTATVIQASQRHNTYHHSGAHSHPRPAI